MIADLRDENFWRRYVPFWSENSPVPFRELAHHDFEATTGQGKFRIKSMLSSLELSLLFALAKDHWTGAGEIVDLGCLYGLTTRCLGDGLRLNTNVPDTEKSERIYAYDLFLVEAYDWWVQAGAGVHAGSWFPDFLKLNRDNLDLIVSCPGDLSQMRWGAKPIEILMVDASKAWFLNHWIVSRMFPRLIPGQSVVIQQDYCNYYEYWCALTMEHYADRFEPLDFIYGASGVFLNTKPISEGEAAQDLSQLAPAQKRRLMEQAVEKAPRSAREVVKTAYAHMLVDIGEREEARRVIESVDTSKLTDDAARDFSGIATSCVGSVRQMLSA